MPKIAIIGAGLSGLILAHALKEHADITVYEKSRGVGGRMATRYTDKFEFDHGAPFFEAQSNDFLKFLSPFIKKGIVKQWGSTPYYVACPRMNSLAKSLSQDLHIELNQRIEHIDELQTSFDWIISTAPYPQTKALFSQMPDFPMEMQPCVSLMLGFENPLPFSENIFIPASTSIHQVIINANKPNRSNAYSLVAYTTPEWSEKNLEMDDEWTINQLLIAVRECVSFQIDPDHVAIHRWRYAFTKYHNEHFIWINEQQHLAACGDWSLKGDVESAYHAAISLASKIRERIK